jgi:hypothetical protein
MATIDKNNIDRDAFIAYIYSLFAPPRKKASKKSLFICQQLFDTDNPIRGESLVSKLDELDSQSRDGDRSSRIDKIVSRLNKKFRVNRFIYNDLIINIKIQSLPLFLSNRLVVDRKEKGYDLVFWIDNEREMKPEDSKGTVLSNNTMQIKSHEVQFDHEALMPSKGASDDDHILWVIDRMEKVREHRHIVYDLITIDFSKWSKEQKISADNVCREFDILGLLLKKGIVPRKIVKDFFAIPAIRCWNICEAFIESERKKRNQPTHFKAFEELVTICRILRPDTKSD